MAQISRTKTAMAARLFLILSLAPLFLSPLQAQDGHWEITHLPVFNALHPSINNSGEIVYTTFFGGVYSTVRGSLSSPYGENPHIANSGEVVYAEWFGGPAWDLVSSTRGRLTYGSIIDINESDFDVNASGEVVYATRDTNNTLQVYSTVRGQLTDTPGIHFQPCINDAGEIMWTQYEDETGTVFYSTVRGILPPALGYMVMDLNNHGDFCYGGNMEIGPNAYSSPHIFSSKHGVIINDPNQFQWDGTLNDAGAFVWSAPIAPDSPDWALFEAHWASDDITPPLIAGLAPDRSTLWPPNGRMISVQLNARVTDDTDPAPVTRITRVTCNEPTGHLRRLTADWEITGPLSLNLRAIRTGKSDARVYTITVESTDASGNVSSATVDVRVPRDLRHGR